jgi:riboflavin synthase alpha subunit
MARLRVARSWMPRLSGLPAPRRRGVQLFIETLEQRELLSTYTWNGNAGDGNWDTGTNWIGESAPTSGIVDIVFPNTNSNQTITLQPDDADLQFDSIDVQGGSYTLQSTSEGSGQLLNLTDGSLVSTENGGSLSICPSSSDGPGFDSLALNFLGAATTEGTGSVNLYNQSNLPIAPASLRPIKIGGGTITVGNSTSMLGALLQVNLGATLEVPVLPAVSNATIGSLSGDGRVKLDATQGGSQTASILINTPSGESDSFTGSIGGAGGLIDMEGAGALAVGSINPDDNSGPFQVEADSGTLLVNDTANAQKLTVASGATFGGPGALNFSSTATFNSKSTFAVELNGTGLGQYTQLVDSDLFDQNPVDLGDATLSPSLGYAPAQGDSFTIISAPNGVTGQFAGISNGDSISIDGIPFRVLYTPTSVTLTSVSSSTYFWTGNGDGQSWDDPNNWIHGANLPGLPVTNANILLPNGLTPTIVNHDPSNGDLTFNSIMIGDGYTIGDATGAGTFQGTLTVARSIDVTSPSSGLPATTTLDLAGLSLADGAQINVGTGASIDLLPDTASPLTLSGSLSTDGNGDVNLITQNINPGVTALRPVKIGGGKITIGSSTTIASVRFIIGAGAMLEIPAFTASFIGSLTGSGPVEIDGESLTVVGQEVADEFDGTIQGSGDFDMNGTGVLTTTSAINLGTTGSVEVNSGTLLINGHLKANALTVASGATLGGPGAMTFAGPAAFNSNSTFAVALNGTGVGRYTQLVDSDLFDQNPVDLSGATLLPSLGYAPAEGDSFTIISAPNGVTGQFAGISNGQSISVNGVPFQVTYNATSVVLTALASVSVTTTQLTSSLNPSHPGQSVTFTATVSASGAPVTTGTVTFYDGNTALGSAVDLDDTGTADLSTPTLPLGNDSITATYNGTTNYSASPSPSLSQVVQQYSSSIVLALTQRRVKRKGVQYFLSSTVSSTTPGDPVPSGIVVFKKNGQTIASVSLSNGVAQFDVGRTKPTRGTFTASFMGGPFFSASASNSLMYGRKRKKS